MINYAHRGASEYAPENTLSSFYLGLLQGANGIETDVSITKDGELILFHDDTLDRVTDHKGKVSDYTLAELKNVKVFCSSSTAFYDRIITLREFLEKFSCYNIFFAIELKDPGVEAGILSLLREFGVMERTTITSFHFDYLAKVKQLEPTARIGWLQVYAHEEERQKLLSIHGEEMAPKAMDLTAEDVHACRAAGLGIRAWGLFNQELMKKMCRLKVDGMTVNFPDQLSAYLNETKEPLFYGKLACDTIMRKYHASELMPKGIFHYHQGVFLSGMYQIYRLCGDEKYWDYIKAWVDSIIDEHGEIHTFNPGQLDDIQPGVLLYPLYEKTQDQRYKKALDTLLAVIKDFPRNEVGGFWHKTWHENQMWLDGLYMAGPISAEYAERFEQPEYLEIAIEQALLMQQYTRDEETGLWYHAWDYSRKAPWADADTGLSPEFWGRSIGWVPVAVLNELDFVPQNHPKRAELEDLVKNLLTALCKYQSEDGRWYQVVSKGGCEGNWLENSCSCLYVAAICKAVRIGILEKEYLKNAQKGYSAIIRSLGFDGEDLLVGNVCVGTGVGDYPFYCNRPTCVNDLHGMGAFLIMCAEYQTML